MPRIFQLKTFPKSRYRERVELSGALYDLVWTWRARTQGWYVDVYRDSGEPVALGRRVRVYANALRVSLDIEGALYGIDADYYASPEDEFEVYYVTPDP